MKKNLAYGFLFFGLISLFAGCTEVKNDKVPVQPVISVHGEGFADPSSANFHASYIQGKNYDLQLCKTCHGSDYAGGTSGQSCTTCHTKQGGPENCTTCHGSVNAAPPFDLSNNTSASVRGVGAHQKHLLGGVIGAPVACKECHTVPSQLLSAGHIDNTEHAEIRFDTTSIFHRSDASYSAATVSCNNTYCHGNFNGGNLNRTVSWTDVSGTAAACGTCHGDATKATLKEKAFPVSGHSAATVTSDCSTCHGSVVNANMTIINPARHINGRID